LEQLYSGYGRISQEESLDVLLDVQKRIFNKNNSQDFERDLIKALSEYYGAQYGEKLKKMCDRNIEFIK